MRSKHLAWLIPFSLVLFSCGKNILGTSSNLELKKYEINEITFDNFSLKSKVSLVEEGKNQKATALIRVRKDSLIWFNLSGSLGIQGMRGVLTKDSIKVLDRLNKDFYKYSYKDLSKRFNFELSYDLIESMILGNLPYHTSLTNNAEIVNKQYILKQDNGNLQITNYVNQDNKKLVQVNLVEKTNENKLTLNYGDFQLVDSQIFPFFCNISLIYNREEGKIENGLNINHVKVEFPDKPLRFPFNIPNKYEKE